MPLPKKNSLKRIVTVIRKKEKLRHRRTYKDKDNNIIISDGKLYIVKEDLRNEEPSLVRIRVQEYVLDDRFGLTKIERAELTIMLLTKYAWKFSAYSVNGRQIRRFILASILKIRTLIDQETPPPPPPEPSKPKREKRK